MSRTETVHFEKERGVTSVTVTRGIAHVTADLPAPTLAASRLALLKLLAQAQIPVFLIKLHPTGLSFALAETYVEAGAGVLDRAHVPHTLLRDLALVTTLAGGMRDLSGVMARIYQALVGANVRVRQNGDAYNAVFCLVDGRDAARAADALRVRFELLPPPVEVAPPAAATTPTPDPGSGLKSL